MLATSDLHMQVTCFDYVKDREGRAGSLAKLAGLIDQARRDTGLCLLFDNGDTFQGTPMADYLAKEALDDINPMAEVMNLLGYDALGLGNHDFDLGLEYLDRASAACAAPTVCSNLKADSLPHLKPSALLERQVIASDGETYELRIGILSVLPYQTAVWNRKNLGKDALVLQPLQSLRDGALHLRDQGADIIVALAHMGIARIDEGDEEQNQVVAVAAIKEIDVVIGGHTHTRFPGPDHVDVPDVDTKTGKVSGKPTVLPGHGGSDLGIIDLTVVCEDKTGRWRIATSETRLCKVDTLAAEAPRILQLTSAVHEATRSYLAKPVAQMALPMNTYFALASPSPVLALMAEAKRHAIRIAVTGTEHAHLPLLAAASTPSTGGFEGPDNFVAFRGGQVLRRDIAGLNPFANQVWAVRTTGAQLIDWLERSAVLYNTLQPGLSDQLLIDPQVPGFRFDAIYGLSYLIDPTRPARFERSGRIRSEEPGRITDVRWQGAPIDPQQEFLVATTDHRAGGGGAFKPIGDDLIVVQNSISLETALLEYLDSAESDTIRTLQPWKFAPDLGVSAVLSTTPEALNHLDEIASLTPEPCGETEDGFALIRLHL